MIVIRLLFCLNEYFFYFLCSLQKKQVVSLIQQNPRHLCKWFPNLVSKKKKNNINIVHTREYWKVLGPTKIPYQKKNLMIYHQIRETGRTENFPANPRTFYFVLFIFDHWCHFYLFCILFHIIIVWCKFCKYWNRFSSEDFKPLFYFGHTFKN